MQREQILELMLAVIAEFNQDLPPEKKLPIAFDTPLLGRASNLDSMGLVHFIVATEEKIFDDLGLALTLADERALSQERSPFRTLETLADYITVLVNEHASRE